MSQPTPPPSQAAILAAAVVSRTLSVAQSQAVQARITRSVVLATQQAIRVVPSTPRQRARVAQQLHPVVERARIQSYSLAVRHMQSSAARADVELPPVPRPEPYVPAAIETVLETAVENAERVARKRPRVSVKVDGEPVSRENLDQVTRSEAPRSRIRIVVDDTSSSLARHAHQAGRTAVEKTAEAGGEKVGWARVLSGAENCAFCAMLASRGPVFSGKSRALNIGGINGNPYHNNCDCTAVIVFEGKTWEGEGEYDRLEQLWIDTTKDSYGKAKLNAFRRSFERPNSHLPEDNPWLQNLDTEE